jgi:thiol-disulfide isomerase/thioredoxin
MKKLFFLLVILSSTLFVHAQTQKEKTYPYQKDSTLPSFSMLQTDSSTWFNSNELPKGKPVVIVYFNPECGHCQLTAHEFMEKKEEFKDAFFVWITYRATMDEIKQFGNDAKMFDAANIRLGKEMQYSIVPYYGVHYTPYIAVYNDKGKLLQTYDGGTDPDTIYRLLYNVKE